MNISIYSKLSSFWTPPEFRLRGSQPAIRPGTAKGRPPDFSQDMYMQLCWIYKSVDPLKIPALRHLAR